MSDNWKEKHAELGKLYAEQLHSLKIIAINLELADQAGTLQGYGKLALMVVRNVFADEGQG